LKIKVHAINENLYCKDLKLGPSQTTQMDIRSGKRHNNHAKEPEKTCQNFNLTHRAYTIIQEVWGE